MKIKFLNEAKLNTKTDTDDWNRQMNYLSNFEIENGVLVKYTGKDKEVTIPNGVTKIGEDAFADCTNLTNIIFPDNVTEIGESAFCHCTNLTNVTIPNSITKMGSWAFYWCTSLTDISIPNSVAEIGECAFYYCKNLTITCHRNSYADKYARRNNISIEYIEDD